MHALLIVVLVLLSLLVMFFAIIAFVALSVYFTLQPILDILGKIAMVVGFAEFGERLLSRRARKRAQRQRSDSARYRQ
ncbi:MAG: hypothetical protein OWQ59_01830 [Alicyclobacillaceae bacterium]|nr:hypothetical protein [Alicyclobacillaceae bacterium]